MTLVLHIGTPKTGSTSIQHYCRRQKDRLLEHGINYLTSGDNVPAANRVAQVLSEGDLKKFAFIGRRLAQRYQRDCDINIMSGELFWTCPPGNAAYMVSQYLHVAPDDIEIVVYLRRQDLFIESLYLQRFLNGKIQMPIGDFIKRTLEYQTADFHKLVKSWQTAFPQAKFKPRIYHKQQLVKEDSVTDFFHAIGKPKAFRRECEKFSADRSRFSGDALFLLQIAQQECGADIRMIKKLLKTFPDFIDTNASASPMSHADRVMIMREFRRGNQALRAEFFPKQRSLFHRLPSRPAKTTRLTFTSEQCDLIEVFLRALHQSQSQTDAS